MPKMPSPSSLDELVRVDAHTSRYRRLAALLAVGAVRAGLRRGDGGGAAAHAAGADSTQQANRVEGERDELAG